MSRSNVVALSTLPSEPTEDTGMAAEKPIIRVEGLAKRFPTPDGKSESEVFGDVWFSIEKGEFVCLIGHSGCGKTTMLNILAGLDEASAGAVIVVYMEVTGNSLAGAVVFQTHALLRWMSGMRRRGVAGVSGWPGGAGVGGGGGGG